MTRTRSDMSKPIMAHLEHMVTSVQGWDEDSPHLFALYQSEAGRVRHGGDLVPELMWRLDRPPQVLQALAEGASTPSPAKVNELEEMIRLLKPAEWIGLVFMHEAWFVEPDPAKLSQQEINKMHEDSRNHVVYKRDDKIEARIAWASTTSGSFFALLRRDTGEVEVVRQESEGRDQGAVPESLLTLFDVFNKSGNPPDSGAEAAKKEGK